MRPHGIAIWGTGDFGHRVYQKIRFRYPIQCFLDSCPRTKTLYGIPVMQMERFLKFYPLGERPLVVVATRDFCADVVKKLLEAGFAVGKEFITYRELPTNMLDYFSLRPHFTETEAVDIISGLRQGKKLAVLYGNCQIAGLQQYLLHSPGFAERYVILSLPLVCEYTTTKLQWLYEKFWALCDLFIAQRVSRDNRFCAELATDNIAKLLPHSAYCVWIPNAFFVGYFPQARKNLRNTDMDLHLSGRFPFADYYTDMLVRGGGTPAHIKENLLREDFLEPRLILDGCENSLAELRRREERCDVKISDYIHANYRERQIFYSRNHPSNDVLRELSRRILNALGINDVFVDTGEIEREFTLKGQDVPLYPSVIASLGLKEYDTRFYPNRYLWPFYGNLIEFTEEYLKWCWGVRA